MRAFIETLRYIPRDQILFLIRHRFLSVGRRLMPKQAVKRVQRSMEKEWPLASLRHPAGARRPPPVDDPRSQEEIYEIIGQFEAFQRGKIRVLNREETFPPSDPWSLIDRPDLPPLVVETLHYDEHLGSFARLLDCSPPGVRLDLATQVLTTLEQTLDAWWRRFPIGEGDAWHPFTVAFRISVWLKMLGSLASCAESGAADLARRIERSLFEHGLVLEKEFEYHLGGNHLFKDLCALAMLSGFFEGPTADRWFARVKEELPPQIEKQILEDGGHYERSPMYHILVMGDLLDAAEFLTPSSPGWVHQYLDPPLERMASFLLGILHPDGEIPLFNDSVLGQAPNPARALFRVAPHLPGLKLEEGPSEEGMETFASTGITRIRRGGLTLIMDHGRLGPDELMGHVHNDTLSFELSYGTDRFIVDRGVYEYSIGPRRQACRSIASHNTPCVDGLEQAETWAAFRVARRWHPSKTWQSREGDRWEVGGAWKRLGMPRIERIISSFPGGLFVIHDRFIGEGSHRISIPIHFAPGVKVQLGWSSSEEEHDQDTQYGWKWRAVSGSKILYGAILSSRTGALSVAQTTYWPRFYVEEPIQRLNFEVIGDLPPFVATAFVSEEGLPVLKDWNKRHLTFDYAD